MNGLKLDAPLDEAWVVHIYDRNRRLRCTLSPSHVWTFFAGLGMGALAAIVGVNLSLSAAPQSSTAALPTAANGQPAQPNELLLRLD
ncbi:hypothetical protein IQ241_06795 [Romeria aff. gracilis LEGE 07310]|uniref:Uncharacterized protein n=1 Tax=Vasconcelosia minhoensis LEGE 07310 TaxID=915328 RepID=A0A8J7AA88_9CYAN|nr:hypothetical protein [Romeria gracilis]MBE9077006.1 hypothetical protein [Romeria aff. gracilis LEGE 07310]